MLPIIKGIRTRQPIGEKFSNAIGQGLEQYGNYNEMQKMAQEKGNVNEFGKSLGIENFSSLDPAIQKEIVSQKLKGQNIKQNNENDEVRQIGQNAFNGIAALINKNNVGRGSKALASLPFAYETQKDVGEFESLTGGLESMLVDMVNKGTLSNTRFKYITETLLPKPNDPQETIKGKLKGLAQILNLDDSALGGNLSAGASRGRPSLSSFQG